MAKYNLTPKKEKVARYQTLLSDKLKDSLYEGILRIIVAEGKYKDKTYNTRKLAADPQIRNRPHKMTQRSKR